LPTPLSLVDCTPPAKLENQGDVEGDNHGGVEAESPYWQISGSPIPVSPDHPVPGVYRGALYFCEGECEGDRVLSGGGRVYQRVRRELFKPIVANVPFKVGESVRVRGSVPPKIGLIRDIQWHFKRQSAYYTLSFGKRLSTRWYFPEELSKP
jgi:hypothetical protein